MWPLMCSDMSPTLLGDHAIIRPSGPQLLPDWVYSATYGFRWVANPFFLQAFSHEVVSAHLVRRNVHSAYECAY